MPKVREDLDLPSDQLELESEPIKIAMTHTEPTLDDIHRYTRHRSRQRSWIDQLLSPFGYNMPISTDTSTFADL